MGLFGGFMEKTLTTSTNNEANYNLTDSSQGAGDNGVVAGGDVSINITATDGGAIEGANTIAGQALGTAVNAQTLAAMSLGVVSQGIDLQAFLAGQTKDSFDKFAKETSAGLKTALDASTASQRAATNFATQVSDSAIAASKDAARLAANTASDAITSNNAATRGALTFADSALISVGNSNRQAFNFAGDALLSSLSASGRAVTSAENALDSSLSFARQSESSTKNFLDDVLSGVFSLDKTTSERAADEATATRDFAGEFVGDFYESQKSGDVQTLQQLTKTAGAVLAVFAIAWAFRGKLTS
jgi:hypothetical protein